MTLSRSSLFRTTAALSVLASFSAIAFFVGCGSDDAAGAGASSSSGGSSGSTSGGASSSSGSSGSSGADGSSCEVPNALGKTCDEDASPCPCGLTCLATKCVEPAKCNDALLSWTGPTSNTDGTCLRGLAGFVIYGAPDASNGPYTTVIDAGLPCIQTGMTTCGDAEAIAQLSCSYRVEKLANGTWYFRVTSFDDAGTESVPTGEVSKVIACP